MTEQADVERIPYGRHQVTEEDIQAVVRVLRGDWLTTGPTIAAFEAALKERLGARDAVVVSSGTAALHAAYCAAGVGHGDEVIVPPLTFGSTAYLIARLGGKVVFADVEEATLTLDPTAAQAAATPATKAIVPVDYAGNPADLEALGRVALESGALLIEDAAHAIGSRFQGEPIGSISDMTVFSFHAVKTITTGEGGAITTRGEGLGEAMRRFRNHGIVRDPEAFRIRTEGDWHQEIQEEGLNYRMPDINAALGLSQLQRLEGIVRERKRLFDRYCEALHGVEGLRLPVARSGCDVAWHLFVVRIMDGRRREVFDSMRAEGIGVQVHYLPVNRQPLFEDLGYRIGMCPVAESAYEQILSLPLYPGLTDEQQDRVIDRLRRTMS